MAERAGCVVLGPGIGKGDDPQAFARAVAGGVEVPLLIDADGLNAHAGALDLLRDRSAPDGPDTARGRARPPAGGRFGRGGRAPARARARGAPSAAARSSCSRATTRSSRRPSGHRRDQPGRHAGARHGRNRRRPVGDRRRAAGQGRRSVRGRGGRRARPRLRRTPRRRALRRRPRGRGRRDRRRSRPRSGTATRTGRVRRAMATVREYMDADPITVAPDAGVEEVARTARRARAARRAGGRRRTARARHRDRERPRDRRRGGRPPHPALRRAVRRAGPARAVPPLRGAAQEGRAPPRRRR